MTEKAQRELYLAIRKAVDLYKNKRTGVLANDNSLFIGILSEKLNSLLTAPQFKLNQLDYFEFLEW